MSGTELKRRLTAILAADAAGYSRLMSIAARATVAARASLSSTPSRAMVRQRSAVDEDMGQPSLRLASALARCR